MLDLRKKIVPDKGSRNRQRPVTKALKFLSRKKIKDFQLGRRVQDGEYTERQDDRYCS